MKTVYKLIMVLSVVAFLALLECILNCACNLSAYPVPQKTLILDNTKIEQQKKLTLLVYMAADNDLESHAIRNLKAMERADAGSINVLVLLDRAEGYDETNDNWTDTRLFEIVHDKTNSAEIISKRLDCPPLGLTTTTETELDLGSFTTLKTFVEFGKENYKAEKYALIIWGHGTGWRGSLQTEHSVRAVAIDDKSNSYICVKELGQALQNQSICVIGFDTCFGSVFENLYELKDCTQFISASPGLTPASGWDYNSLLTKLCKTDYEPEKIAAIMAESSPQKISITNTSELQGIMNKLEDFSKALSQTIIDEQSRRSVLSLLLNTKAYCYTQYPCDMYLDIFSMTQTFTNSSDEQLKNSAQNLAQATQNMQTGLFFIPKTGEQVLAAAHSPDYLKNDANLLQCAFIKESLWWVPTREGDSQSVLDKLFYWNF